MWLYLDLDGIELHFRITKYRKSKPEKMYDQWCQVDLTLHSGKWLCYQVSSEILMTCEVEEVCNRIYDLLEEKIQIEEELEFIEPDLSFVLNPKKDLRNDSKYAYIAPGHEIIDIDAELRVHFWNDALTANYLSLFLDRNDLECLAIYLQCVTNKISQEDKAVQELIKHDVIRPSYNV